MYEGAPPPLPGVFYTEVPEQPLPQPAEHRGGPEPATARERLVTTLALSVLGAAASYAEYRGLMHGWPEPLTAVRDSGRHPLVGYIGAAIASRSRKFNNVGGMLLAATGADIGTEAAQAVLLEGPSHILEPVAHSQLAGNIQDYIFALGGSLIWAARSRFSRT